MDEIFQRLLANNFSELPGLSMNASIPMPEDLVNEILDVALRGNHNITYCRVKISRENRVIADVKSPLLPWTLHLKMKLFHSVDFTGSPKLRAFLENNLMLGKLGSWFNVLPKGITIYNDQLSMDIESLTPAEYKQFLSLVKSVELQTEENKLILHVKIEK
jgi:hypothetical protein